MFEITPKIREDFIRINELLRRAKNILITAHSHPDGDAIGSMLALKLALDNRGFNSSLFCFHLPPREFLFLSGCDEIKNQLEDEEYDLVFALDYGDLNRLGIDDLIKEKKPTIISIDHHPLSTQIGEINIIEPTVSSTAEIIYYFLQEFDYPIDKDIASCLLTGVFDDTGGFCHANTSRETLLVAGELLLKGARLNKIVKYTAPSGKSVSNTKLWGRALSRIKRDPHLGLVYSIITQEDFEGCQGKSSDLDGITSLLNTISDSKYSLLLVEYERGKTKGSLRSEEYKGVDVSKIAKALGGGGHKLASGFRIDAGPQDTLKLVIDKSKLLLS